MARGQDKLLQGSGMEIDAQVTWLYNCRQEQ